MRSTMASILYWAPRVLGISMALFVAIFALDVIDRGFSFWQAVGGFLIHLVPTYLLLIAVAVGWRWEIAGGALFIALGGLYIAVTPGFPLSVYLIMSGIPVLTGLLFLVDWFYRSKNRGLPEKANS